MTPESIGISYLPAIGRTYVDARQNLAMANSRPKRTILERAIEAAAEHLRVRAEDLTFEQIGKLAGGIKQSSVSLWRRGGPRLATALIFAQATNICVEWLYTERGPKRPEPAGDARLATLQTLWPGISDFTKGRILALAEVDAEAHASFREAL
jgi:hypothetical protein